MNEFSNLDEDVPEGADQQESSVIKVLRQQVKEREREAREALARAAEAERQLAFRDAGLDLTDPRTAYFVKAYDGEISAEAIRAEAEKAGFLAPPEPPAPRAELQEHQQIASMAATAGALAPDRQAEYEAALSACTSQAQVLDVMRRYGSPTINEVAD